MPPSNPVKLKQVVLLALDVVNGPYVHCCAPPVSALAGLPHSLFSRRLGDGEKPLRVTVHSTSESVPIGILNPGVDSSFSLEKMKNFNDIFVPRPEFCRCVSWVHEAGSGLLYLYYPEEVPGQHYQRKTLRYTVCFVFSIPESEVTANRTIMQHVIVPYSVVLKDIVEELRDAEVKYGYVSMGLRYPSKSTLELSPDTVNEGEEKLYQIPQPDVSFAPNATDGPFLGTIDNTERSASEELKEGTDMKKPDSRDNFGTFNKGEQLISVEKEKENGASVEREIQRFAKGITGHSNRASKSFNGQVQPLNTFVTPLTEEKWTPLDEMVASIYHCLCYEEENLEQSVFTGTEAAASKEHTPIAAPYARDPTAIYLSDRIFFHIRRMPQPCPSYTVGLDQIPVPIVPYDPVELECSDITVQDVFRMVDGINSVADIAINLAARLKCGMEEYLHRVISSTKQGAGASPNTNGSRLPPNSVHSLTSSPKNSPFSFYVAGNNARQSPPHSILGRSLERKARLSISHSTELPYISSSSNQAKYYFTFSPKRLLQEPNELDNSPSAMKDRFNGENLLGLRLDSSPPSASHEVSYRSENSLLGASLRENSFVQGGPSIQPSFSPDESHEYAEVSLPRNFDAILEVVNEVILQLEMANYLMVISPIRHESLYQVTPSFANILCNSYHPGRAILGSYMIQETEKIMRLRQSKSAGAAKMPSPNLFHFSRFLPTTAYPLKSVSSTTKEIALFLWTKREAGNGTRNALSPTDASTDSSDSDDSLLESDQETSLPEDATDDEHAPQPKNGFYSSSSSSSSSSSLQKKAVHTAGKDGGILSHRRVGEDISTSDDPVNRITSSAGEGTHKSHKHSEYDIQMAAAAATCALGKFTSVNSFPSMQSEMRNMPIWSTSFLSWNKRCCKALVCVALLNGWLEEVINAS